MPLEGVDEGLRKLEAKMKAVWDHTGVAWKDTVDVNVLHPSLEEVPVLSGTLRGTGRNDLTVTPNEITCEVGYGSESTAYALYIHENLAIVHPYHINAKGQPYNCGGKAKYLEDPVNAAAPRLMGELKKRLAGEI